MDTASKKSEMTSETKIEIAILARAPVAGAAKTRLIPLLGPQGAARLHECLALRMIAAAAASGLPTTLWGAPDASHPFFAEAARQYGVALRAQPAGDLGARMAHVFAQRRAPTLLVGTDCPTIDAALLGLCAEALRDVDAVFLPAEDGGYGLVGLQAPQPALFEGIAWGSESVMAQTRAKAHALGLACAEPAIVWDVDRPEDVERLRRSGQFSCVSED